MGSPRRPHGVEQWTETDQAIIESLLLADSSSTSTGAEQPPITHSAAASPLPHGSVIRPPDHASATANTAAFPVGNAHGAVPVAFWIPAQPIQHSHPYYILHPSAVYASAASSQAHASFDEQDQLTEEERKAKHRAVQRRFVQRKKEEMTRIRQEVARLEKRFKYLQLSSEQQVLELQNTELQDQVGEPVPTPTTEQIEWLLEEECRLAQEAYVPLGDDEFSELLKQTMDSVHSTMITNQRQLDDSTKVHVMGWTGRRVFETGATETPSVRFEISKHFPHAEVDDVVERAWRKVTTPEGYRRLFSRAILMKLVVLQRVNDDAVVIFKTIFLPTSGAILHSVDLLGRIRTKDEVLIFSKGLPMPNVREALPDPSNWSVSLNALAFRPAQASGAQPRGTQNGVDFRYNCCIEGPSEANLRYWLMEILFVMVRFENMLVAPLFALAAP